MIEACGECRILRREPVEDIISWLNLDDFKGPAKRVLIYGEPGVGKTMAVNQIGNTDTVIETLTLLISISRPEKRNARNSRTNPLANYHQDARHRTPDGQERNRYKRKFRALYPTPCF